MKIDDFDSSPLGQALSEIYDFIIHYNDYYAPAPGLSSMLHVAKETIEKADKFELLLSKHAAVLPPSVFENLRKFSLNTRLLAGFLRSAASSYDGLFPKTISGGNAFRYLVDVRNFCSGRTDKMPLPEGDDEKTKREKTKREKS